ncbi:MAG: dihydrofolate reductase [Parcubacteria bacterium C7867-004]|nr:MAG: dihydrofolate reductase [Parcubacteria bacterium C7867-004]
MSRLSFIAAIGERSRVLGKDGGLVWDLPGDLARFRSITKGHPVIMGRKTWESIPLKHRPMPARANIVVTRDAAYDAPGGIVCTSLPEAIERAKSEAGAEEIFIIGGTRLFEEAMPIADRLYLTLVDDDAEGDVFFPPYPDFTKMIFEEAHEENGIRYRFVDLERE